MSARRKAIAAQRSEQPAESAPQDSRISSLRARLAALPHHYEDENGVMRNATPLGKVDS